MCRGQPVERSQRSQLDIPHIQERGGPDEQGIRSLAPDAVKGGFDFTAGVGVEDLDLQGHRASGGLHVSNRRFGAFYLGWVDEHGNQSSPLGTSSRRSSSRFAVNSPLKILMPVTLPPGRARLATRPSLTGSSPEVKAMGIVVVAALAAEVAGSPGVAITATRRRTRSLASSGSRSI